MPVPTTCLHCGNVTMRAPAFSHRKFCNKDCYNLALAAGYNKGGWQCAPGCTCAKHAAGRGRRKDKVLSSPCRHCGATSLVSPCHAPGAKNEKKFCNRVCFTADQRRRMEARRATGDSRKYDMSTEEFENRMLAQGGRCAICSKVIGGKTAHRDHCHVNGQWRGLLCSNCNLGLGNFQDDPALLMKAAEYVLTGGVVHVPA